MADCCQLVGNLNIGIDSGCIISVNVSSSTEVITSCGDEPLEGATVGSISISAYADTKLWEGCPFRAGVSIPFIRKYDCENNDVYFIFSGQGQSFYSGPKPSYVSLYKTLPTESIALSASSSSGPASVYTETTQINGYGMNYNGAPIDFTTTPEGTEISLGRAFGRGPFYLQSFSIEAQPGQLPVANYSIVYNVKD